MPDLGWVNTPCGAEMASVAGTKAGRSARLPATGMASVAAKVSFTSAKV